MGRSLWKGKTFIKEFVVLDSSVSSSNHQNIKLPAVKNDNIEERLTDIRIYRRNHKFGNSQFLALKRYFPCQVYNGYDFLTQQLPEHITELGKISRSLNLGARVLTRESKVVHKAKTTKAMRKKPIKKVTAKNQKKLSSIAPRKMALTKRIRK